MNSPHGLMCTIVSESKYCSGITRFTTFSITSLRKVSNVTFSECWSETTTVWTRFGMHAPWSNKYSQVTYSGEGERITHFNIIYWEVLNTRSAEYESKWMRVISVSTAVCIAFVVTDILSSQNFKLFFFLLSPYSVGDMSFAHEQNKIYKTFLNWGSLR